MKSTATLADFNPTLSKELGLPLATDPTTSTEGEPKPVAANPSKVNPEFLAYLQELSAVAVEQKLTATEALRMALKKFPEITRKEFKHSAIVVGINPLTARNTFDRLSSK